MSWKEKAVALYKRYGTPAKFAAKLIVGAVVPGGSAVVDLVGQLLDCVHETAKDQLELDEAKIPAATAADLKRVEEVLDVLSGDLAALTAQVAALEDVPETAAKVLDVTLATDDRCRAALHKLDGLARGFDRLAGQNDRLLQGQGYAAGLLQEILPLLRRSAGIADFVEDMRAAGLTGADFRARLAVFRDGERALGRGRFAEAGALLLEVARSQPQSGAAAAALAAAQAAGQDLVGAEKSLGRAVRLRPADAELGELHRRVTQASRGATPADPGREPAPPPKVGVVLDGWRLEQLLGRGGWGQVFKASRAGQMRALKVMHPALSRDPDFIERFKSEILTLAALRGHKYLVEIHSFGYAPDSACWYFVMEFVEGVSLEHYLMERGPLPPPVAAAVFMRVAMGLAAAHARGVVHRDVKPANILLRKPTGSPVLVDFGLAATAGGSGLTRPGHSAGCTPLFAAPEQLRGKAADARTDVYALAASLYYALTYDKPERREPDQFEPELAPEAWRDILIRSLHPRPEKRPANAAEFRDLLGKATASTSTAPMPDSPPPPVRQETSPATMAPGTGEAQVAAPEKAPPPPPVKQEAPPSAVQPPTTAPPFEQQRKPGEISTNSLGMKFAWIPPGAFLMGSPLSEEWREAVKGADETQHKVTLTKGFWLGVHQVTQAQWQEAMGRNPSYLKGQDLPVERVTWEDAVAFCKALGEKDGKSYRLPTEAEWEYACRAGTTTPFHFGETISTDQANYNDGDQAPGKRPRRKTKPVGSFPANAWGLYDMHGNILEWCADWFGPYPVPLPNEVLTDPQGPVSGESRVLRGGTYRWGPGGCRSANRYSAAPDGVHTSFGFRICVSDHFEAGQAGAGAIGDSRGTQTAPSRPTPMTVDLESAPLTGPAVTGGSAAVVQVQNEAEPPLAATPTTTKEATAPPPAPTTRERSPSDLFTNSLGMKFAWIPPGTFVMGSPPSEEEREGYKGADETQHKVTLTKGFLLGVHQVTQAQWQEVMGLRTLFPKSPWTPRDATQAQWQAVMGGNPSRLKGLDLPVQKVTWEDAAAFCKALGERDGKTYRLPTEAEWEYACRAGTTTPYHFGETISTGQANYDDGKQVPGKRTRRKTKPVGSFPANAWGLFDMHGNVLEWCADWYGPYPVPPPNEVLVDPQGPVSGEDRVLRGGEYRWGPGACRSAFRCFSEPGFGDTGFGFRVCFSDKFKAGPAGAPAAEGGPAPFKSLRT